MLVDYVELRQAQEKVSEQADIIKRLRIELSEARQIARDMVQSADVSKAIEQERERCAKICETLPLVLLHPNHYSFDERHIILVTEAGCRGAFAQAIRGCTDKTGAICNGSASVPKDICSGGGDGKIIPNDGAAGFQYQWRVRSEPKPNTD